MTPIEEIQAERKRQIEVEGWTAEHDDQHSDGEMLTVAVFYYRNAVEPGSLMMRPDGAPLGWPWGAEWWKPKEPPRDLVRAGALCLAEIERIRRRPWRYPYSREFQARGDAVEHVRDKLGRIVAALAKQPVEAA